MSFYWHDYETFGIDPARDRPCQFAGIRTDEDLNIISDPLMLYCQLSQDCLPIPGACLVTGISPQLTLQQGVPEVEFMRAIHAELAEPATCGVGYNSVRFDDEFTRHALYRNFYDPYAREWQHGNSRWDIIDMVRLTHALRPEGIIWPTHEDGTPSFRLEDLTRANGISHEGAHDALADVYATIAVARLIKTTQPRLFDYVYQNRNKKRVASLLNIATKEPVLHVSPMLPADTGRTALVMPLAMHPTNPNGVIVFNLSADPTDLLKLDIEALRERLFTPVARLADGVSRLALKTIHTNKCPVVATAKLLDPDTARHLNIDLQACDHHRQQLQQATGLADKIRALFAMTTLEAPSDPELQLYSGGFFADADHRAMDKVRASTPQELARHRFAFKDQRLPELLFRYRARNFPDTLSSVEKIQWEEFCRQRLTDPKGGGSITLESYYEEITRLQNDKSLSDQQQQLLQELRDYGGMIANQLLLKSKDSLASSISHP